MIQPLALNRVCAKGNFFRRFAARQPARRAGHKCHNSRLVSWNRVRKPKPVTVTATIIQPGTCMKTKPQKKAESAEAKTTRLSASARQASRKADVAQKSVALAKASLKAARRAYKLAKRAAKKAAKKAARCEDELQDFLKSLKRKQPKPKRTVPARRPARRKATRRRAAVAPVAAGASGPVAAPETSITTPT